MSSHSKRLGRCLAVLALVISWVAPLAGRACDPQSPLCPPPDLVDIPEPTLTWTKAGPVVAGAGVLLQRIEGAIHVTYNGVRPASVIPGEIVAAPGKPANQTLLVNGKYFAPSPGGASVQQTTEDYEGGCSDLSFCYNAQTRQTHYRSKGADDGRYSLRGIYVNIVPIDSDGSSKHFDFWYELSTAQAHNGWRIRALQNDIESLPGDSRLADFSPAGTVQNGGSSTITVDVSKGGASIGKSWTANEGTVMGNTNDNFTQAWAGWGGRANTGTIVSLRNVAVFESPSTADTCWGFGSALWIYSS